MYCDQSVCQINVSKVLKKFAMYQNKITQDKQFYPSYDNYSIYYQLKSALSLNLISYQSFKAISPVFVDKIKKTITPYTNLTVAIPSIVNPLLKEIRNRFFLNLRYWQLCILHFHRYIFGSTNISIQSANGSKYSFRKSGKESKPYKVVEILKKNVREDTPESDTNNINESPPSHTKTKKSIFATLIKRKHARRPKVKITKKIETCSTVNMESDDASSEQEIAHYQVSAEYFQPQDSGQPSKSKPYSFFQKIIKKSPMMCGDFKEDLHREKHTIVPTAYMPKYDVKLINGIYELQDILENLNQSEEHMIYLLKRYIEDTNFQNQLIKASAEYFGFQYDCKCHTNLLANSMWTQQIEDARAKEYSAQQKMTFLVKTNRALQFQVENLSRQCEKLADRTSLYPKRFLHMRSFGKTYARNLIENNRKLVNKLKALTEVLEDFEDEMQKLQQQKGYLDEEKRNLKAQLYKLEGVLERNLSDREMEKASLISRITNQSRLLKDCDQTTRYFMQDLIEFELQTRQMNAVALNLPKFAYQDGCLPEIIYQLRIYTSELLANLIEAYANAVTVAKDVNLLRNTNARLQENLQKSTNELDNLSRKLDKNSTKQFDNNFETKCHCMHQENYTLKVKLETSIENNQKLEKELEAQKKLSNECNNALNEISSQNVTISNQINAILQVVTQLGENEISRESTNQEKLEYFCGQYSQVVTDRKHLTEKCNNLEDENQNFLQNQQMYQHDLTVLQEAVNILSSENEFLKKQTSAEHQTVLSLQNERLKYLEEKNILKTIFQHLKAEVSRIQQLENAVADMSKETNRLALVAEFNKQLGEHLKSEVEVKDHTIVELNESLEKLSHIQIDNDKEKLTLCAQLSEISTAKDKLTDCLEEELKKNMHLDESKKKIESTTKSQLKVYEEMQKNERAALKELLRDFKGLIKQRDSLLQLQDECKRKHQKYEQHFSELKQKHDNAILQINEKNDKIAGLEEKLEEKERQLNERQETKNHGSSKYEKTLRKFEKIIGQIRNEKGELESTNIRLKSNLQKTQSDLNESTQKEKDALNQLAVKAAETTTLEAEIKSYKNDLQEVNQENGKLKIEVQYLTKICDQQTTELSSITSKCACKESVLIESHTSITAKDHQITELNKLVLELENKIKQLEQERGILKKQNEDQNKILCAYENQLVVLQDVEACKQKLEKELFNVQSEQKYTKIELENTKKEIKTVSEELKTQVEKLENEKMFYKNQASDLLQEYSEQKEDIESEIDNISNQLRRVNESLYNEKRQFDDLSKAYNDLKEKFAKAKDTLNEEVRVHQETRRKLEETDSISKSLEEKKEKLQQQVNLLTAEINEEKEEKNRLSADIKRLELIIEQGRQQYGTLISTNEILEREVKKLKLDVEDFTKFKDVSQQEISETVDKIEEKNFELKSAQNTIQCLKRELADNQKKLFDMRSEFFKLQQQVTGLEFKNCELTLQVHEAKAKLETERNLYRELKNEGESAKAPPSCGQFY